MKIISFFKIFFSILTVLVLIPFLIFAAECTDAEVLDRGLSFLELGLMVFGGGAGAVALRYIRAVRATLAAVMKSLDDNPHVDNNTLVNSAQLQDNLTAFKQFQTLPGTEPSRE